MDGFYSKEELKQFRFIFCGENVLISKKASLYMTEKMSFGHDIRIDDYSGIGLASATIPKKFRKTIVREVAIEEHGLVGAGCTILPGAKVAKGCSIGAMSLLTKPTEPWGIYVGIPAKRIKERSKNLLELETAFLKSNE